GASIAEGKSLRVTSIIPWGTNVIGENINGPVENLRATAAPVFDELIHITRFFENRVCPGVKIKEIIISGSGANITNLADTFKQETGLPTKLANPFAKIETSHFEVPKQLFHTFSDAIGLAMRDIK
ncbi:MAG: pilus assembly protein PilM, partial [Patescibacteria group bacterium]